MRLGQVIYFSLIVALGTTVYASHMIAGNIESFTYMPAYGLATCSGGLNWSIFGKRRYLYSTKSRISELSLWGSHHVPSWYRFILRSPNFAELFTKDLEAIHQVVIALKIDAFNQPGLAVSLIMAGALQGLGDTKSPLYSTAIGMWGQRVVG